MSTNAPCDVDRAVARYREDLSREADLGRARLDEIEDHLRSLIDDLQSTGMPAAHAVTEAARRLGDPRAIARESARVRTPFGAKLPMWRALAVIALVIPQLAYSIATGRMSALGGFELAASIALCGALVVWRSSWARAVLLGAMVWNAVWGLSYLAFLEVSPPVWMVALQIVAAGLLLPSRRGELTTAGWALSMIYPIYASAAIMYAWQFTYSAGDYELIPWLAPLAAAVAGAGVVLRARWASIAALAATGYIALLWQMLATTNYYVEHPIALQAILLSFVGAALVMTLAVALIGWRSARSNLGTLRGVLD